MISAMNPCLVSFDLLHPKAQHRKVPVIHSFHQRLVSSAQPRGAPVALGHGIVISSAAQPLQTANDAIGLKPQKA